MKSVVKTLLLACMMPSLALADMPARELKPGEEAGCKPVTQQKCSTGSMKPEAFCADWHARMAADAGADAYVVRGSERTRQTKRTPVGMETEVTTHIRADYFLCGKPAQQPSVQPGVVEPRGDFSSVEKRLQVLESLKSKGLINEGEYQQKRKDILSDL